MNTREKPKKAGQKSGLDEERLLTTIDVVKQHWPDYPISLADIRNPTASFVLKFYRDCMEELDEKIAFVTRTGHLLPRPSPPSLCEEEILYLKLCRIPALVAAQFKLGDLYVFEPKRLIIHMFITMHFLNMSDSLMDKMVQKCNEAFEVEEKRQAFEQELNEIKEKKMQAQIDLTLANSEIKKYKELTISQIPKYTETLNLIQISEAKCKDSILEAERLRNLEKNLNEEIQKLEKTEDTLKSKILPEDECESLKAILKSLEKDDEDLQIDEQENDLLDQVKHVEVLQSCVEAAKHLELDRKMFELSKQREELKNISKDVEHTQAIQESTEAELAQMKIFLESQIQLLKKEIESIQAADKINTEKMIIEEAQMKKQHAKAIQAIANRLNVLENEKIQTQAHYKMLKNSLSKQYLKICNIYKAYVENFNNFLLKAENKMNEIKD